MSVIKVRDVAYPIIQVPELKVQEEFLQDFGMKTAFKDDNFLFMRGAGKEQYLHVSREGERKFIGTAFYANSLEDLNALSKEDKFSSVEEIEAPGGGFKVTGEDLDGIIIEVVCGIEERKPDKESLKNIPSNLGGVDRKDFQRINETKRVGKPRSSTIKKIGHIGHNVADVSKSFEWYNKYFGFIPSDIVAVTDDLYGAMFCRCDLGEEPTDHHTLLIGSNLTSAGISGLNHVSYEVADVDDVFLGHEVLKDKGYRHEWGIGRHYLGSQVFDYWRSPYGHVHEHMCDTDVFDNKKEPGITNVAEAVGMQWGPDLTGTFGNDEGV